MSKPLKKPASERSKDRGPPPDPTNDTEVRGYLTEPGMMIKDMNPNLPDDPATEAVEPDRERFYLGRGDEAQVADPPASTTRGGYEGYEQGEATAREPTDIPMPPEWKGTESQWAALSPQKKEQFVADTEEAHRASQMYVPPGKRK
jgi:hypothetical protein